jgi:glutamate dehydrogenase (NADP+)
VACGGSVGRDDATARGAYYITKEIEEQRDWKPSDVTVAIQGFGNAGQHYARLCAGDGYRVVAISDSSGAVYNPEGLDVDSCIETKNTKGNIPKDAGKAISNEELLELDVGLLAPAALENVITENNAGDVKAKVIMELANGPLTIEADEILHKNDQLVVPDVLANSGGVTVSYFEWVQNRTGDYWKVETVHERLREIMAREYHASFDFMNDRKLPMRTATYALALGRIGEAHEAGGTESDYRK